MAEQNAYQIADWNGQTGERWVANQARLDAMLAVFGQAAIKRANLLVTPPRSRARSVTTTAATQHSNPP